MGEWISTLVRYVSSTTASASANPFATSPRSYRDGSRTRFGAPSWTAGAPVFSASSISTTNGRTS